MRVLNNTKVGMVCGSRSVSLGDEPEAGDMAGETGIEWGASHDAPLLNRNAVRRAAYFFAGGFFFGGLGLGGTATFCTV